MKQINGIVIETGRQYYITELQGPRNHCVLRSDIVYFERTSLVCRGSLDN